MSASSSSTRFTPRARFLAAAARQITDHPPVWLMRQAGRHLPEYRELRAQHDFMAMLSTPDLITEISLQPWRRYKTDAVIVFADILLLPWKKGMGLKFVEGQGAVFDFLLHTQDDWRALKPFDAAAQVPFLTESLRTLRATLQDDAALIGFAGSPWTVASYICASFEEMKIQNPDTLHFILQQLTLDTIQYLFAQIESGIDTLQIFDSWGGLLTAEEYDTWSGGYIRQIVRAVKERAQKIGRTIPLTLFLKDSHRLLEPMLATEADVLSIGYESDIALTRARCKNHVALQGNFHSDILLNATPSEVARATEQMLQAFAGYPGYIANLGHGVLPKTPVENVEAFVKTVHSAKDSSLCSE